MNSQNPTPTTPSSNMVGVVLPGDNRTVVLDSTSSPACWIGQVATTWSNGKVTIGSGVLYGELHVLTCAHNFIDLEDAPTAVSARFTMGLNRKAPGVGVAGVAVALNAFQAPPQYHKASVPPPPSGGLSMEEVDDYRYDIAIARLNTMSVLNPPGPSPFKLGPIPAGPGQSRQIGYSGDLDPQGATQYDRNGMSAITDGFLTYTTSSFHGDSGSPVFYPVPSTPSFAIKGVHVSGVQNEYNFAVPLTPSNIDLIGKLIEMVDNGQGVPLH